MNRTVDTAPARAAMLQNAAERAVADPAKLSRAVRIVRGELTVNDLTDPAIGEGGAAA